MKVTVEGAQGELCGAAGAAPHQLPPHLGSIGRLRLRVDHVHDLLVEDVVRAADVAGGGLAAHLVQALAKAWVVIGHPLQAVFYGLEGQERGQVSRLRSVDSGQSPEQQEQLALRSCASCRSVAGQGHNSGVPMRSCHARYATLSWCVGLMFARFPPQRSG